MSAPGYVKLWRQMQDHPVMQDDWLCRLWIWCLFQARYRDGQQGLKRGQFMTSRSIASAQLGVSGSKWHRGIAALVELGSLTIDASRSNKQKTLITVCNFGPYQDKVADGEHAENKQRTSGEQAQASAPLDDLKEGKKERSTPALPTTESDASSAFQDSTDSLPPLPIVLDTPAFCRQWADWIAYRRERRLTRRPQTLAKQLELLASVGESRAISTIEMSIRNGWQGLFPEKTAVNGKSSGLFDGLKEFVSRRVSDEEE